MLGLINGARYPAASHKHAARRTTATLVELGLHRFDKDAVGVAAEAFVERADFACIALYMQGIADADDIEARVGNCLGDFIQSDAMQRSVVGARITAMIHDAEDAA